MLFLITTIPNMSVSLSTSCRQITQTSNKSLGCNGVSEGWDWEQTVGDKEWSANKRCLAAGGSNGIKS